MRFSKEVQIGLTVLGTLICLYIGIMYLRTRNVFPNPRILYTKFENAEGIDPSTRVLVKGYEIGQVQNVEILDSMLSEFLISISLSRWIQIPKSSVFKIKHNLLGGVSIELDLGKEDGRWCQKGDTLPAYTSVGQLGANSKAVTPDLILGKINTLADSLIHLVGNVNILLKTTVQPYMRTLMANLEQTTHNTAEFTQNLLALDRNLRNTMENMHKLSGGLLHSEDKLQGILEDVHQFSRGLAALDMNLWQAKISKTIDNFSAVSQQLGVLGEKLTKKQGSLGLLINDDRLYQNVNRATTDLRLLLRDLKANPSRYLKIQVFGGSRSKVPPALQDSLKYE